MGRERDRDGWLNNYSFIPDKQTFRHARGAPKYEVFTGSKPLTILWLALVAAAGGALGSVLVSGWLWSSWLKPPLWPVVAIAGGWVLRKAALAVSGQPTGFYTGWCFGWAMLIAVMAMWGAQLSSGGWAYGIAAGMGFIVGITHNFDPDDLENNDVFFGISMIMGPVAASLAAWLFRNSFGAQQTLEMVALTGAIAGPVFLVPSFAYLLTHLDQRSGMRRLAMLMLHRDETLADATEVLNRAIRLWPEDASFYDLRGLANSLRGRAEEAEADWTRHRELAPTSMQPSVSRGWAALRRGDARVAIDHFQQALGRQMRDTWALAGLGKAFLSQGKPREALAAMELIRDRHHDALSLTILAEAQLRSGDAQAACDTATDAIDELDSAYGRSFYVRAEAFRALGRFDEAALDYNRAFHAADEEGLDDLALAGLDAIERPLEEDEPEY